MKVGVFILSLLSPFSLFGDVVGPSDDNLSPTAGSSSSLSLSVSGVLGGDGFEIYEVQRMQIDGALRPDVFNAERFDADSSNFTYEAYKPASYVEGIANTRAHIKLEGGKVGISNDSIFRGYPICQVTICKLEDARLVYKPMIMAMLLPYIFFEHYADDVVVRMKMRKSDDSQAPSGKIDFIGANGNANKKITLEYNFACRKYTQSKDPKKERCNTGNAGLGAKPGPGFLDLRMNLNGLPKDAKDLNGIVKPAYRTAFMILNLDLMKASFNGAELNGNLVKGDFTAIYSFDFTLT